MSPPAPLATRHVGVLSGVGAYAKGASFLVGSPRLWPWAMVPIVVFFALAVGLSVAGIGAVHHALAAMFLPDAGVLRTAAAWLAEAALTLAVIGVAFLLALSLTQALSGFALDRIGRAQEEALGAPPRPKVGVVAGIVLGLRATLAALVLVTVLVLGLTVLSILVPPLVVVTVPLKVLIASLGVAWDLLDYPLGARGYGVRARLRWIARHWGAVLGFALAAGVTLFVPGLNLLLLPWGVAGATRLVVSRELPVE